MTSLSQPAEIRHKLPPLPALTAIRFFAAMHVVLLHESHWRGHIPFPVFAARIVDSGNTAVILFFVLSGFILAYNYQRVPSKTDFWISRFARIYPVYLLSLLPPLVITPHWSYNPHPGAMGLFLTFFLLQGWWPPLAFSLNVAAWTLSVEAFFYAVFPYLLPWTQRLRAGVFLAIQAAYLVLVCLPPLLALGHGSTAAGLELSKWLESSLPVVRLNAFFLGMYSGIHFQRSVIRKSGPAISAATRAWLIFALLAASLGLLWLRPTPLFLPLRSEGLQICYTLLIYLLAAVDWRVLSNHVMQMAGEISYSIYILQFPVLFAYNDAFDRLFPRIGHISLLYIATLCCVSYLTFRFIEVPARILIRRSLTGRPVPLRPI